MAQNFIGSDFLHAVCVCVKCMISCVLQFACDVKSPAEISNITNAAAVIVVFFCSSTKLEYYSHPFYI